MVKLVPSDERDQRRWCLSKGHRYRPDVMDSPPLITHATPRPADLARLASFAAPVISIYMNTHVYGRESAQDGVRFGDLVDDVATSLQRDGNGGTKRLLAPLRALATNAEFWQHQHGSLALFGNDHLWECFSLGVPGVETVAVDDTPFVLPLVPHIEEVAPFLLLALSKNAVRLFECDEDVATEVTGSRIPASFDDALRYEDPQAQLQFHSPGGVSIAHGHGVGDEVAKQRLDRFLHAVDRAIIEREESPTRPLVLAAVDSTAWRYRHVSVYPTILDRHISGNPDRLSAQHLHEQALAIIREREVHAQQDDIEHIRDLIGTGNVDTHTDDIAASAQAGRVATLFLANSDGVFGESGSDPDSRGRALNRAVIDTIRHGGKVAVAPTPLLDGIDAFAVTRW